VIGDLKARGTAPQLRILESPAFALHQLNGIHVKDSSGPDIDDEDSGFEARFGGFAIPNESDDETETTISKVIDFCNGILKTVNEAAPTSTHGSSDPALEHVERERSWATMVRDYAADSPPALAGTKTAAEVLLDVIAFCRKLESSKKKSNCATLMVDKEVCAKDTKLDTLMCPVNHWASEMASDQCYSPAYGPSSTKLRTRLANLSALDARDVFLFPTGMSAIFSAYR
jgi:hypothetical protein